MLGENIIHVLGGVEDDHQLINRIKGHKGGVGGGGGSSGVYSAKIYSLAIVSCNVSRLNDSLLMHT